MSRLEKIKLYIGSTKKKASGVLEGPFTVAVNAG